MSGITEARDRVVADSVRDGECLIVQGRSRNRPGGYVHVDYRTEDGQRVRSYAHRVVYLVAHGSIAQGLEILHACDRPDCIEVAHLSAGTSKENSEDMVRKDRGARGERQWNAKLTPEQIQAIRLDPRPPRVVALEYPVSEHTIRKITSGERWKHIDGPVTPRGALPPRVTPHPFVLVTAEAVAEVRRLASRERAS